MNRIFILLFVYLFPFTLFAQVRSVAQKPVIDTDAIDNWPVVGDAVISNDGNYVAYDIYHHPVGGYTLVIQSIDGEWKK